MIGVAANPNEWDIVREFFELFKTPWEPAAAGSAYRVVVSTIGLPAGVNAGILISYGTAELASDRTTGVRVTKSVAAQMVECGGEFFPLYRGAAAFDVNGPSTLRSEGRALDYRTCIGDCEHWRVGYNLFDEVQYLLTQGQPASYAMIPTLDRHVGVLRTLLTRSRVPFVEVKPHPPGHPFISCLTHDIDFYGIRRHMVDRTLAGFVARASVGTVADLVRRRRTVVEALRNWAALLSLPLVFLRMLPDPWRPLEDYERADGARPSTFFVIPFRGRAGRAPDGGTNGRRAVKYQASEVAKPLSEAAARGHELAVHGIDAWRDGEAGRAEMGEVAPLAARRTTGVRMHWLYFDSGSPGHLEAAGFDYDSTRGYNDAVGYRSGTAQAYRLPGTRGLLELPLTIMDSALFYPGRMGLNNREALEACRRILAHAQEHGGTVVVNWHDRSLSPERQWGDVYRTLLDTLEEAGTCFMTAGEAVDWFRWRRSIAFQVDAGSRTSRVAVSAPSVSTRGAVIRVVRPGAHGSVVFNERPFDGTSTVELGLPLTDGQPDARQPDTSARLPRQTEASHGPASG